MRKGASSGSGTYRSTIVRKVYACAAFTLVETSIALAAVGLVTGGVIAGQDMIEGAKVRSQMAQITQYNVAVADFKTINGGEMPGDMKASKVLRSGFGTAQTRAGTQGRGDGNGVLEGVRITPGSLYSAVISHLSSGENAFIWADLTANSKLIPGSFTAVTDGAMTCCDPSLYLPKAKLDGGLYVYSYSKDSVNYFGLSAVSSLGTDGALTLSAAARPGISVANAFSIDSKMDDGLPQSGNVMARYQNWSNAGGNMDTQSGPGEPRWASGLTTSVSCGAYNMDKSGACARGWGYTMAATPGSAETCYDNGGVSGNVQRYSMSQNGGTGKNCGLSFSIGS